MGPEQPYQPYQPAPQPEGQPQFVPQPPVQPQQPVMAPQPEAYGSVPQPVMAYPTPKKGLSKGALFGIIGGAVGLVLLIAGVVVGFALLGGPSKEDYRKADEKLGEAKTAYSGLSSLEYISTYGATETTAKNDLQKVEAAKLKINSAVDEIGKMKAVNDKDVKVSYDKLEVRMAGFDKVMDANIEIYEKIIPVMLKFDEATSSSVTSNASLAAFSEVRISLEKLELKVDANRTYVQGIIEQVKILEAVIPKKIEMNSDYRKYDASINDQYYDATDKLTSLGDDWRSNLEKLRDEGDIADQLNNLDRIIYDKYLGIKN